MEAATAAYRAAANALLEEHGLSIDEHDRLVVDGEWIDFDEVRELVDEALYGADRAVVAERHQHDLLGPGRPVPAG